MNSSETKKEQEDLRKEKEVKPATNRKLKVTLAEMIRDREEQRKKRQ